MIPKCIFQIKDAFKMNFLTNQTSLCLNSSFYSTKEPFPADKTLPRAKQTFINGKVTTIEMTVKMLSLLSLISITCALINLVSDVDLILFITFIIDQIESVLFNIIIII